MDDVLAIAFGTITSPMVMFFILGFAAAMVRSDLAVPEAMSKALSLYLLFAIGYKGGASLSAGGLVPGILPTVAAGVLLSLSLPVIAFLMVGAMAKLSRADAAAVGAHYGSISIVTFTAVTALLNLRGVPNSDWMVAVAAIMEAPGILTALVIAKGSALFQPRPVPIGAGAVPGPIAAQGIGEVLREAFLSGAVVLLLGAFAIGWIGGPGAAEDLSPFVVAPFAGVLCLFLLDMGLLAGRGLRAGARALSPALFAFGIVMPLTGAAFGLAAGLFIGLSEGDMAILATLAASASYIAAPAAMRAALPEARSEIYLTLALCITFPFNLLVGIPLYCIAASVLS